MKVATLLCPPILCKKSPRNPDLKEVGHSLSLDEKQSPLEYGSVCIPPAVSVDKAAQASGSWELEANVNQKHSIQTCHHISVSHYYWTFKDKSNFKMKKEDFETLQSIARLNCQIFPRGKKWKAPQQSAFRSFQKPQPTVWDWIWMGCEKDQKTTKWYKSRVAWAYVICITCIFEAETKSWITRLVRSLSTENKNRRDLVSLRGTSIHDSGVMWMFFPWDSGGELLNVPNVIVCQASWSKVLGQCPFDSRVPAAWACYCTIRTYFKCS